ncbi:MAG: TIGR01212 family radical SAM protein [Oscillospiraceae bacterium]|nr:TIGR01212 family radical SAM protein [Oscillospiraceae bacterium]
MIIQGDIVTDRYNSLNNYLQNTFGEKVYKISLDLGLTCPNRDGSLDTRGCIFCLDGSSHFAESGKSISEQIENAKKRVTNKTKAEKFIAYFQSYTNTYAPTEFLEKVFAETINHPDIAAISVATRPDCLPPETLDLLERLNHIKPVWVELGLQTVNPKSVEYIRRGYENSVYFNAVKGLKKRNITVITHIIIGLPGEEKADILNTLKFAVDAGTDGVKLQLLHILVGTDLYGDYKRGEVTPLTLEEYMDILFACIEHLPKDIVIHRLTGDAPKKYLAAPLWSADKKTVLNTINREMERRNIIQGNEVQI